MDAFELLTTDHRKVSDIFEQIEAAESSTAKQSLFQQLKSELEMHTHIEETVFYPALKQAAETREITLEALHEHQEVKDMLAEIQMVSPDEDDWDDMIEDLKDAVEHHVEEEEGEMFDKARDVLSEDEINQLGTRMANEKQRGMSAGTV